MKSSHPPETSARGDDVVATFSADEMRQRIQRKSRLKGRQPDDAALAEVRALLGPVPADGWRRDRLIEHLHLVNDHHGGLQERHLVALARETNVPMAENAAAPAFGDLPRSLGWRHTRRDSVADMGRVVAQAVNDSGPRMLEVDMVAIGPFASAFAGPPVRKVS